MTIAIIAKAASFSKSVGKLGLVHNPSTYHLLGRTQADTVKSQLYGGAAAAPVGAPIYNPDSVLLTAASADGFESPANFASAVNGAYTMFAVLKKPLANAVVVNSIPNASHWQGIYYFNGVWTVQANAPQAGILAAADNSGTAFAFVAVRASAVSKLIAVDHYGAAGRVSAAASMPSLTIQYNTPFRIGKSAGGTALTMAAAGCFPNYLSDAQINDVYLQVKDDLARRGVTIL